jgi:uncharacterized protein YkwD
MRSYLCVATVAVALSAIGGASGAGAAETSRSGDLPLSPCLRWGDALPAELSRASARQAIVCLVNEARADAGLAALTEDRRLQRASQRHAAAMDGTGCFSHRCPGEKGLKRRLSRYLAGKPRRFLYGEAISWQPATLASPQQVVEALLNSAEHRYRLLNPKYDELGVGFTIGTPSSALAPGGIYTIDFGMRRG